MNAKDIRNHVEIDYDGEKYIRDNWENIDYDGQGEFYSNGCGVIVYINNDNGAMLFWNAPEGVDDDEVEADYQVWRRNAARDLYRFVHRAR